MSLYMMFKTQMSLEIDLLLYTYINMNVLILLCDMCNIVDNDPAFPNVLPIFITVDPVRDTVPAVANYIKGYLEVYYSVVFWLLYAAVCLCNSLLRVLRF